MTLLVGVAIVFGSGCATTPYNPFRVTKAEIYDRVKTVALVPTHTPSRLPELGAKTGEFDRLVSEELTALGFKIVPASEFDLVFTRERAIQGGFFDPITGQGDVEKYRKIQAQCRRDMAERFNAEGFLYPEIRIVSAKLFQQHARWDGVSEVALNGNLMYRLMAGGYLGSLPALSLLVTLTDTEGKSLYVDVGGLQLIEKINTKGGAPTERVPDADLLVDAAVRSNAVAEAFKALHKEPAKRR